MYKLPSYPQLPWRQCAEMVEKFSVGLIVDFEQRFGRDAAWKRACDLMIAYFSELKMAFPEVAALGLEAAVGYRRGEVDSDYLVDTRAAGRQYLKDQGAVAVQKTSEQHLIRAVALLLSERNGPGEPNDNSSEVILSLWDIAHGFDSNPDRIVNYIKRYFSSDANDQIGQ